MDAAIQRLNDDFSGTLAALTAFVRIASVSAPAYPRAEVRKSAEALADFLSLRGFSEVELLAARDSHPAVYAEANLGAAGPVVLVYGHHDVQPPGREQAWLSPPFEPQIRGGRLYGRGTADDKGGFLAHVAAIDACLECGALPCGVKLLIEGEEEIGSPNLESILDQGRDRFACDFIVLCDTPNYAVGVPALTYRLRGNCLVDVEVRCLERPLHSGQGGGVVPDATRILCSILARLERPDGTLAVPGLYEKVRMDPSQAAALQEIAFDEGAFRRDMGLLDSVRFSNGPGSTLQERLWAQPSLTVTAIESVPIAQAANQIADLARARLSLRTVPDLETMDAGRLLAAALELDPPHGAQVAATVIGGPQWWCADPAHPLFTVARRALRKGYDASPKMIGSGGSIGFLKPFTALARKGPPLLTGVQDPSSHAHSENESLHLGDWRKAMRSAVYLYEELASL